MSLNIGKIRITEELDWYDGGLTFFKFKQNKIEYYCLTIRLLDEREGFLVFSLSKKLDELLEKSDYHVNSILALFKEKIDEFYFAAFEDEDPKSEIIEYCGPLSKEEVLELYNIK